MAGIETQDWTLLENELGSDEKAPVIHLFHHDSTVYSFM